MVSSLKLCKNRSNHFDGSCFQAFSKLPRQQIGDFCSTIDHYAKTGIYKCPIPFAKGLQRPPPDPRMIHLFHASYLPLLCIKTQGSYERGDAKSQRNATRKADDAVAYESRYCRISRAPASRPQHRCTPSRVIVPICTDFFVLVHNGSSPTWLALHQNPPY